MTTDPWVLAAALRDEAQHLDETAARLRTQAQHIERIALVGVRRVRMASDPWTGPSRTGTLVELDLPEEDVALVEWDDRAGQAARPVRHRDLRPATTRHSESETPIFGAPEAAP